MASEELRLRLSEDVGRWLTDGLIDSTTLATLHERYDAKRAGAAQFVRMLGIAGGVLVGFGILGIVAAAADSEILSALMLAVVGAGFFAAGVQLNRDRLARYNWSAKAIFTLGAFAVAGSVGLVLAALHVNNWMFPLGCIMVPALLAFAYKTDTTMVLIVGVLGLFHWVGSWDGMVGGSTYAFDEQDPRLMLLAAAVAIGAGIAQEKKYQRFALAWETCGLIYLNLSLLILGMDGSIPWIAAWAVAGFVQLLLGARLHNGLFTGFGVTVLVINFYTRFFERFWNSLSLGTLLLVGGVLLLCAGAALERVLHRE